MPDFLRPGDALVVNDTRVIAARLERHSRARRRGGAYRGDLDQRLDGSRWRALVRPAKKLKVGERIRFGERSESAACLLGALDAEVEEKGEAGEVTLAFAFHGAALDEAIERIGEPPLPPYIASRRAVRPSDRADYQTVFAREDGAVAAPTAGLHFTPALLERIEATGASLHRVTLHVGAGTFLPVKADDTRDHEMHAEWGRVDAATASALNAARARGGRIVAVGTTSARLIESAADESGAVRPFQGETAIFVTPGYRFRAVDALLTNFHLPRSTLFMLVSGVQRSRRHAPRLRARDRSGLSLLLLRRRLSAARSRSTPSRFASGGRRQPRSLSVAAKQRQQVLDGHRPREIISLRQTAPRQQRHARLFQPLDALGDDGHVHRSSERRDRTENLERLREAVDVVDESLVDLQLVELEAPEVGEARIAGAEIVERDRGAEVAQTAQDVVRARLVGQQHALGDFELESARREAEIRRGAWPPN